MTSEEGKVNFDFLFECEHCMEFWTESLLDLIDRCTRVEMERILKYIQNKLDYKVVD